MNYQETFIYVLDGEKIQRTNLADFLREHCSDQTTTPRGVAQRLHIRENEGKYEVWTWGVNGNNERYLDTFDTKEEAEQDIMKDWYRRYCEGDNAGFSIFDSQEEAELALQETQEP